jgi:hypothetical protein
MGVLILERFCDCDEMGVFGALYHEGHRLAYTVEQPWRDNRPFVSCVPAGRYRAVRFNSPKYGSTFALENHDLDVYVEKPHDRGRWACLIHKANWAKELQGCIAPGTRLGAGRGEWMVQSSADAMARLFDIVGGFDEWELSIIWKDHPRGF